MSRTRQLVTVGACLATFAWLLAPELRSSPAVLWPSVLAVGLVFVTRDLYLALCLGAFSGALLLAGGNPWTAFQALWLEHLLPALSDRWNLSVLVFTLLMGGFVEVLHRNGGMGALSRRFLGRSHSPRRAGLGAFFLGWLVFFDGLASAMLVGKTLRSVADRAGLSREKLAFIVDSTSSPIAGLALLSTWVAYEVSVLRQGLENTGDAALAASVSPFSWLVLSLPFRFYNWFMLWLVFLVVWVMRDWGPMLEAERSARARSRPESVDPQPTQAGSHAARAWVPLAVLVGGVLGGLYVNGGGLAEPLSFAGLVQALGKADAASVFVLATAVATLVALGFSLGRRAAAGNGSADGGAQALRHGMQQMFLPALILVCAWMLNSVLKELGTARYLVTLLGDRLPVAWLPALVFLLAAVVSFSTGTSWGTMAVVIPLTVPLAVELTGLEAGGTASPVLAATVGAVLAGAVFGDHCSPLSDTTIVSALSSECDVLAHVRTQLPYALAAAAVATLLGYLPAGYGVAPGWLLAAGGLACWLLVRYAGKPVPAAGNARTAELIGDQPAGQ
jgi:Na+/H+ antiporter NhaC